MDLAHENEVQRLITPYLSPKSWLAFLLKRSPELLMGGYSDLARGRSNLECFWEMYKKVDPGHDMWGLPEISGKLSTTIPMSLHGDEGRGQKKSHTFVMMLESNLGLEPHLKRKREESFEPSARRQVVNIKEHSFLTKFVLRALPGHMFKREDDDENETGSDPIYKLVTTLCKELRELATEGLEVSGVRWYVHITGVKGDQDFFRKICDLKQCWKKQIGAGLAMCYECGAGTPELPFEDHSTNAGWTRTLYCERPWSDGVTPGINELVFDCQHPERALRRDIFHCTKMGTFRDLAGGCVLLCMWLGYWDQEGESNSRDVLFRRAHACFRLWCLTNAKSPGLRSFSKQFFNVKTWRDYAWINAKGSDCMLVLSWLQTQVHTFMLEPRNPGHLELLGMMKTALSFAVDFTQQTYKSALWLSRPETTLLCTRIGRFLKAYNVLTYWSKERYQFTAFPKKGNLHMIAHMRFDMKS